MSQWSLKDSSSCGLITIFITRQPTQSKEFRASSGRNGDSPCRLICQPCEPSGQGLVMWFRWVSHAGLSLPSPLSDSETVPHYTPCHRWPYRQRARHFLTPTHRSVCGWNDGEVWGGNVLSLRREKYMNCISIFIQSLNDLFTCIVGKKNLWEFLEWPQNCQCCHWTVILEMTRKDRLNRCCVDLCISSEFSCKWE